ncbi:BatD family protein [Bremerella alba]|nr:BatD family protein [Bremerella alba]
MNRFTLPAIIALTTLVCFADAATVNAGNVDIGLSSREAYVGMPVTMRLTVADATNYETPAIPEIPNCDVRMVGSPSQSSQVTIINGRRSETRSVTFQYAITPRTPGTFNIPPLSIDVDGKQVKTQALRFVASKSVTGDLMFVEIAGGKEKVFVGQPLDLSLKIWLKPYYDSERDLTLSESDMWNMISEQTSWGDFADRLEELRENHQRPGGEEVLRKDAEGSLRSYYLYEIKATVYPRQSGKIDAKDVQIIVNYPTELGSSRSPLDGFFGDSPFGGRSPFSRMMNDDFFQSSFGNRLAVTASRPIVGEVNVDATQVLPVPIAGRPADYRGAVGTYRIATRATPTTVNAGDPITLDIGIAGSGPMELVQAPPLSELPALTQDFKVTDRSLAGFVQDDSKVFSTTIRPKEAGITQIPAIPFSFFDPETETFQTVTSEPITITVNQSETLALDAIVGNSEKPQHADHESSAIWGSTGPDFSNNNSPIILRSQRAHLPFAWWWTLIVVPPCAWLAIVVVRNHQRIRRWIPTFQSARKRCVSSIERAASLADIAEAITHYIGDMTRTPCTTPTASLGQLRIRGMYDLANRLDSFYQDMEKRPMLESTSSDRSSCESKACLLVEQLDDSFKAARKPHILRSGKPMVQPASPVLRRSWAFLIAVVFAASANVVFASETDPSEIELSISQQEIILKEAGENYTQASESATIDAADAKQKFESAAQKYQLLVDAGVQNSQLFLNLGNAYMQTGELGKAIVYYERGQQLAPYNQQLFANLEFAKHQRAAPPHMHAAGWFDGVVQQLQGANNTFVQTLGIANVIALMVISSLAFWGLLIANTIGLRFPIWRSSLVPLLLLLVSMGSYQLFTYNTVNSHMAVAVVDQMRLYVGDGEEFAQVATLDKAQGHFVNVLAKRGGWIKIHTAQNQVGWVPTTNIIPIRS